MKLSGTYRLLVYADKVNLPGDNIDIMKKNTWILIYVSRGVVLDVNTDNIKYVLLSCHRMHGKIMP
jgi:hypothetical protein